MIIEMSRIMYLLCGSYHIYFTKVFIQKVTQNKIITVLHLTLGSAASTHNFLLFITCKDYYAFISLLREHVGLIILMNTNYATRTHNRPSRYSEIKCLLDPINVH